MVSSRRIKLSTDYDKYNRNNARGRLKFVIYYVIEYQRMI